MTLFGYHASHEQFRPSALLRAAVAAERAGFQAGMCSDHFAPWSMRQGESGYSWAWLGAALEATSLSFGTVTTPVGRQHPALVAQACATLAEMFPDRFWVALGSGLAINEHITGERWPLKPERQRAVEEAAMVMRRLWAGETVTHRGRFVVDEAVLYTRPERPPLLVGAAISPESAAWVARWADALITIAQPEEDMKETLAAFRDSGGRGKPMFLQAQHSYARTDEEALEQAHHQWSVNIFEPSVLAELPTPATFDAAGLFIRPEDLKGPIRISSSLSEHADWLQAYVELGFDRVYIHNVGRNQEEFIEAFGREVLPPVKAAA
jgi:coenzyme F420-dependent glucose-6-phosphate dehydrogenase